ncbi:hypothetical protein EII34_02770 [Arachnia propionica]|uniref:Uncharacterized protein n=1 Tax=Arachnia propionica TaxID=1750 RepID=A0A3P1TCD4_9ACTN|nr:hypothetical protein [Arachnia propionica]RRD06566.1 hypothetical protein EII34_02770 [Arachnia propionica]
MTTGQDDRPSGSWDELLMATAVAELELIDRDRETVRLIEAGWEDERIAEQLGQRLGVVRSIRGQVSQGEEVQPLTPHEVGLRRFVGEITTEEMMERLRSWPYTFGKLHYDFYDAGSWDDVAGLAALDQITDEEYRELRLIAEQMPGYPHD